MPAPVALFAYARPAHTRKTLDALAQNTLASRSDLVVFCDGARGESDAANVAEVRRITKLAKGFKSVEVVERPGNVGLTANITGGITEVCASCDRVVVVEEDIATSRHFLAYVNDALDRYEAERQVWHVSGWAYPFPASGLGDAYFTRVMNCWGWGTWKDRWAHFEMDPAATLKSWTPRQIRDFNLDGAHDFWRMVKQTAAGKRDSWDAFWYATIRRHGGLCLNASHPLSANTGMGFGEHCLFNPAFITEVRDRRIEVFPGRIEESALGKERLTAFYRRREFSLPARVLRRAKHTLGIGRNRMPAFPELAHDD